MFLIWSMGVNQKHCACLVDTSDSNPQLKLSDCNSLSVSLCCHYVTMTTHCAVIPAMGCILFVICYSKFYCFPLQTDGQTNGFMAGNQELDCLKWLLHKETKPDSLLFLHLGIKVNSGGISSRQWLSNSPAARLILTHFDWQLWSKCLLKVDTISLCCKVFTCAGQVVVKVVS